MILILFALLFILFFPSPVLADEGGFIDCYPANPDSPASFIYSGSGAGDIDFQPDVVSLPAYTAMGLDGDFPSGIWRIEAVLQVAGPVVITGSFRLGSDENYRANFQISNNSTWVMYVGQDSVSAFQNFDLLFDPFLNPGYVPGISYIRVESLRICRYVEDYIPTSTPTPTPIPDILPDWYVVEGSSCDSVLDYPPAGSPQVARNGLGDAGVLWGGAFGDYYSYTSHVFSIDGLASTTKQVLLCLRDRTWSTSSGGYRYGVGFWSLHASAEGGYLVSYLSYVGRESATDRFFEYSDSQGGGSAACLASDLCRGAGCESSVPPPVYELPVSSSGYHYGARFYDKASSSCVYMCEGGDGCDSLIHFMVTLYRTRQDSATPTPDVTVSPFPSPTATPAPTKTPVPSSTPFFTRTPTPAATSTPTPTPTPTRTATPTPPFDVPTAIPLEGDSVSINPFESPSSCLDADTSCAAYDVGIYIEPISSITIFPGASLSSVVPSLGLNLPDVFLDFYTVDLRFMVLCLDFVIFLQIVAASAVAGYAFKTFQGA